MSAPRQRPLVLDSWALVAHFQGEPAAAPLAALVMATQRTGHCVSLSVVNGGELWYTLARAASPAEADAAVAEVRRWGVEFVDVDWPLARAAAAIKAAHRLAYADAVAAALARARHAVLVTGDPELRALGAEVRLHWLGD
jgi:predicted nucleic acid-binding protein